MIQHNHDLEILKQMAMADGILTENEKELFRSYFQLTDKEAEDLFQSIEAELECVQSETEVINWKRKNGIDFEKCIVKMLNPQYYTLQEYAPNTARPDFLRPLTNHTSGFHSLPTGVLLTLPSQADLFSFSYSFTLLSLLPYNLCFMVSYSEK